MTIRNGYEESLTHADKTWGQVGLLRSLEWLKPLRRLKARPTKGGFRSLLQIIDSAGHASLQFEADCGRAWGVSTIRSQITGDEDRRRYSAVQFEPN